MKNAHMHMISLHIFLCNYDEEIKENKMHVGDHHASKCSYGTKSPSPSLTFQSLTFITIAIDKKNNLETIKNNSHE